MHKVFRSDHPNWDELINPQTDDARARAMLLTNKYKMDPRLMKQVDDTYGPLEWRLPEAHAIYWAVQGLKMAEKNEKRVDPEDLVTLRRVIYQSMHLAFQRGRLVTVDLGTNIERVVDLGPNLRIIPKANKAYEDAIHDEKEAKFHDGLLNAHRYFLLDVVFYLYMNGQTADAQQWYNYLAKNYPNKPVLDKREYTQPGKTTLQEYVDGRTEEEFQVRGEYNTRFMLESLERQALRSLAVGDDDQATALDNQAKRLDASYRDKIAGLGNTNASQRLFVAPLAEIRRDVLTQLLSGELPPELTLRLASKTGQTNLPVQAPGTNAPAK